MEWERKNVNVYDREAKTTAIGKWFNFWKLLYKWFSILYCSNIKSVYSSKFSSESKDDSLELPESQALYSASVYSGLLP